MLRPNVTALIIASALFMENLDSTIISTALPTISADIGSDPIRLKLALTAYLLSLATFIPISGWAADRFGARLVFRCAIAIFVVGSVMCSASSSLAEFVVARIVQGAGGAMMTPVGRLVLLRATEKSKLLDAMAWFTTPALLGPMMGPPVGGFIATYFDWRWIFWINVPVGIIGITLVTLFIEEVRAEERPPLDVVGFVLSGVGLSGLVFGLSVLGQGMLPLPIALGMVAVGLVSGGLYLWHARRVVHPLLDLDLFRTPTFFTATVGGSLFRIGVGSIPFLLPLTLQLGLGMTAFASGSLVFLSAAGALLMKMSAKPIVARFGFRTTLIVNGVIASGCIAAMASFVSQPGPIAMASILLVGGFFRSLQFTCINALAYADVSSQRMSRATSLSSVAQQVSLALGVAVGAFVVEIQRASRGGHEILASDFVPAFLTVAAIAVSGLVLYLHLPRDAGAEVSGATVRATRTPVASA
ncbi:MFS transporter [Acuticoccus sediminis]|nr:MFS transporter [Acuticoccus sediminis]